MLLTLYMPTNRIKSLAAIMISESPPQCLLVRSGCRVIRHIYVHKRNIHNEVWIRDKFGVYVPGITITLMTRPNRHLREFGSLKNLNYGWLFVFVSSF